MSYKIEDIRYEVGKYWVLFVGDRGFDVYKTNITHSVCCARIGYTGDKGLQRAKDEANKRHENDQC